MGFEQQILEILNATPKPRQTLLFSATMPPEVEVLAGEYLVKPVKVKVGTVSAPNLERGAEFRKSTERCRKNRSIVSDARGGEDGIGRARQRAADVHRVCRT